MPTNLPNLHNFFFQTFFKKEIILAHVGLTAGDFFCSTVFWLGVAIFSSRHEAVHLNQTQIGGSPSLGSSSGFNLGFGSGFGLNPGAGFGFDMGSLFGREVPFNSTLLANTNFDAVWQVTRLVAPLNTLRNPTYGLCSYRKHPIVSFKFKHSSLLKYGRQCGSI